MDLITFSVYFIIIYFCNLVLDYPLQGNYLAKGKENSLYLLWVHSCIWGLGLTIVLFILALFSWWKVIFLVGGHFIIDYWKAHKLYQTPDGRSWGKVIHGLTDEEALYVDQLLHILQILVVILF